MPIAEPSTRPTLIAEIAAGDAGAWERFVAVYGPLVYQWSRRVGLQASDAADVMQETLASVHAGIDRYDPNVAGNFRGWLWTITRRRIADAARKRPDELPAGSAVRDWVDGGSPPGDADRDHSGVRRRAVLTMRDRYEPGVWAAFWETAVVGRAAAEVAEDLGVTKWAVYKARSRVLRDLKEALG